MSGAPGPTTTCNATPMMRKHLFALLLCGAAAACGDRSDEVPPEVAEARRRASSIACIGEELARDAEGDLGALESTLASPAGTPGAGNLRPAAEAAAIFARAFVQHARLRSAAAAQVDSSLNHSPTPRDSARYAETAARFEIRPPDPGTVEANVIDSYDGKVAAILNDPDHPCNWKQELEGEGRD